MGPEPDSLKSAKPNSYQGAVNHTSVLVTLGSMSLVAWELLARCWRSALGHACIAHLKLNTAIFKRLTGRGIQQSERSEGRPEEFGRTKLLGWRHESFPRSKNLTEKTVNGTQNCNIIEECLVPY